MPRSQYVVAIPFLSIELAIMGLQDEKRKARRRQEAVASLVLSILVIVALTVLAFWPT